MNNREITSLWSRIIIEELVRLGADFFCISPGSRSAPLTVAVARHPGASWKIFPDERSAGFFALGYARSAAKPAVLICTSGTAVANYYPAVVEASMDSQPMLILSADRPFELLETGANQTIQQFGMFGTYTRWNFRLPEPSSDIPLRSVISTIDHAVSRTSGFQPGPVHLNVPFREPFEPVVQELHDPWLAPVADWIDGPGPLCPPVRHESSPDRESITLLRNILAKSECPFLIAGKLANRTEAAAVGNLARSLNIPLYADLSSGLRLEQTFHPLQLAFQSSQFPDRFRPDTVIHFGGPIIARQPGAALRSWNPQHHIVVKPYPGRYGPDHNVTLSIEASPAMIAEALKDCREPLPAESMPFPENFFTNAAGAIDRYCIPDGPVSEISAARIASSLIDDTEGLFLSNSMPVRDMDLYAATCQRPAFMTGMNRGASGIDGIISTAAGFAEGLCRPVTLLIGDIAFLHDLNALCLLTPLSVPLRIVVLNNNGGGIFSFLPVAAETDVFETHFGTPQNYSIRDAAATFGIPYSMPASNREFEAAFLSSRKHRASCIIEVRSNRKENVSLHRALQSEITALAACDGSR
jgi:2-succinyl-5-enolpyruvyl-6-hydroxy-3-cyclohexene-1-carboxylate synthase